MLDTAARRIDTRDDDYVIFQKREDLDRPTIFLSDMLPLLESRAGRKKFFETFPDMHLRKVFRVKGLFNAKVLPRPEKFDDGGIHVLCDENISNIHVLVCQRLFGYATSVSYERMTSKPDADVWRYAREKKFDLIVTIDKHNVHDFDLTRIVLADWKQAAIGEKLPQLLHLTGEATQGRKFGKLVAANIHTIFNIRMMPDAPVMHLNQGGVRAGLPPKKTRTHSRKKLRRQMALLLMQKREALRDPKARIPLPG